MNSIPTADDRFLSTADWYWRLSLPMIVRMAELADLNLCCELDSSYVTDYVWQMHAHENERSIEVRFDTVRLPRPMKVEYPRHPDELLPNWRRGECFLAAADDSGQPIGFLDMTAQTWHGVGWIQNLIVHQRYRRQGVATALLRAARYWALDNELSKLMLEAQTKNYPAIRFAQKHRFVFCGYNDRYYSNGDIAVFFSLTL
jgi:GNAT superfamily N-acetyltransferase